MIQNKAGLLNPSASPIATIARSLSCVAVAGMAGCATQVALADRVQTVTGPYDARYIEQVDFSYVPAQPLRRIRAGRYLAARALRGSMLRLNSWPVA